MMHLDHPRYALVLTLAAAAISTAESPGQTAGAYVEVPQLPDTPAGRRAREIIDTVNAGDQDAQRAYARRALSADLATGQQLEDILYQWRMIGELNGELEFHSCRRYESGPLRTTDADGGVVAIVRTSVGSWRAWTVEVEPEPPHRIERLMFSPARPPVSDAAPALSAAAFVAEVGRTVDERVAAGRFSGVVHVVHDGTTIALRAGGVADEDNDRPITAETRFNSASCTKMFTAATVARLVERGELALDDPIGAHLPAGTVVPAAEEVTIRELLTHTSGFGDHHVAAFYEADRASLDTIEAVLALGKPWAQEAPRGRFHYSNLGYNLLARIVETTTGESFDRVVTREVFGPAGMTARFDRYANRDAGQAIGYMEHATDRGLELVDCRRFWAGRGTGSGGALCSTADFVAFGEALASGQLLTPETTRLLLPSAREPGAGLMALAGPEALGRCYGHTGSNEGASAVVAFYPEARLTIVVLSNRPGVAADLHGAVEALAARVEGFRATRK